MWKKRESKGDISLIQVVSDHVEKHIGKIGPVLHEKVSPTIHVDVIVVPATLQRPYTTLVTTGMAELPMPMPRELEQSRFAELMICPPADWPITPQSIFDENFYWPIRLLKGIARYPHEEETWLFEGHTIPGAKPEGFAPSTRLSSVMLTSPKTISEKAQSISYGRDRSIRLWALVPLYDEELSFKLASGYEDLRKILDTNGITELLNSTRNSVISLS